MMAQFGNIGIGPHFIQTGKTFPRDDKTSGKKRVLCLFGDLIGFTGDQRFVDLYLAADHKGVCRDLIAGLEDDQIIQYQLIGGDDRLLSVAKYRGFGRVEHA